MHQHSNEDFGSILRSIDEKKSKVNLNTSKLINSEFSYPSTEKNSMVSLNEKSIDYINNFLSTEKRQTITLDSIKKVHANLIVEKPGEFRESNVKITTRNREVVLVATYNEIYGFKLKEEFINWLNKSEENPINIAILAHLKFLALHPFHDGNGRMAHIIMKFILWEYGYPITNLEINSYNQALRRTNDINYFEILRKINKFSEDYEALHDFYMLIYRNIENSIDNHINQSIEF